MGGLLLQIFIALLLSAVLAVLADAFATPHDKGRPVGRSAAGLLILMITAVLGFAVLLTFTGAPMVSAAGVAILTSILSLISNIKRRVLGEPLVFSDFALIGAVFQHPQFYLSVLRPWQTAVLAGGLGVLVVTVALLSGTALAPRVLGVALGLCAWPGLALMLARLARAGVAAVPNPEADVARLGLTPCLLAHWHVWRRSESPRAERGPNQRAIRSAGRDRAV